MNETKSLENTLNLKYPKKVIHLSREIRKYEKKFPEKVIHLSREIRSFEIKYNLESNKIYLNKINLNEINLYDKIKNYISKLI